MSDPSSHRAPDPIRASGVPAHHGAALAGDRARALAPNWRGVWTLYQKEVRRFAAIYIQTMMAPVVTTLLFLAIFTLALGGAVRVVWEVPFPLFLAPGLIMMSIAQNAFANTSSSVVSAKIQGSIVDVLMTPLKPSELVFGFTMGGVTRGLFVGIAVGVAMAFFVPLTIAHPGAILFHGIAAATMLSLLGLIGGIWALKFDHIGAVTNFVITPLAFLSGTFYSIDRLPEIWRGVAHFNPFFYMIDGFRFGFLGRSDTDPWIGVAVMLFVNLALWLLALRLLRIGYRLKA